MKLVLCLVLSMQSLALAEPSIKVEAGDVTRMNSPATARVEVDLPSDSVVALEPRDGSQTLIAQVEREGAASILRWIEPELAEGTSRTFKIVPAEPQGESFRFADGDGYRELLFGEKLVCRDVMKYDPADHANTFKTFRHVYAFDSNDFITKGPGGKYPHHRGIFFGFKTQHGDFWHCPDVSQRHDRYEPKREFAGPLAARAAQITKWISKDGSVVARDTRDVTTWRVSPIHYILDYAITLENLKDEPLDLTGDAHHAGFHFRAAQEVAEANNAATYTRPEGAKLIKDDIWENGDWLAATFKVKGKPYAVALFDAPTNPRPLQFSSRPYGRFGSFFKTTVAKDKPLVLRYRVIVRDGATPPAQDRLAAEYADFATPVKVTVNP